MQLAGSLITVALTLTPSPRVGRPALCIRTSSDELELATWEEEPWEEVAQPAGGVFLHIETGDELTRAELAERTEVDCKALMESANLTNAQLSLTLCDDSTIQGAFFCACTCCSTQSQCPLTPVQRQS